ncbi:MAG: Wzz/FepE/Etk N-terminal domain-containing protein [Bacteroidaceae bacterium]|jgi:LPS O-antigen subunit length determinant protein (WzzB/FepE family)
MEENPNYNVPFEEEDEGIDFIALIKTLWDGRRTVIIWTCIFIALGLIAALTMQRKYTVTTVMVPQTSSKGGSSLSSLASLAGVDLSSTSSAEISPLIYPKIVSSIPFRLELLYTPLHFNKVDTPVDMMTYSQEYAKPTLMGAVKKYTIGLPSLLMKAIRGKKEDTVPPDSTSEGPKPLVITNEEGEMLEKIGESVSLMVDKKEGFLTLTVKGIEPIQTAELAMKALQLLQDEVTRLQTEKAQSDLDYIQARYDEAKAEAEQYQERLAVITDRSQSMTTTRDRIERDRIQSKYTIANSIYTEMAKQLEQSKMQVKKDTPVFTIIQPVKVPIQSSNSRSKTLIMWTFFGVVIGCGIVLGKGWLPKLKAQFAEAEENKEAVTSNE